MTTSANMISSLHIVMMNESIHLITLGSRGSRMAVMNHPHSRRIRPKANMHMMT